MSFARAHRPLAPRHVFFARALRGLGISATIIGGSLLLGTLGYHYIEHISWLDAQLNASMILTGEGPLAPMRTSAGKIFASAYALFSGVAFLTAVSTLFAAPFHRFLHRFHLEIAADEDAPPVRGPERRGL
ncbi:MAG: hypothetical protein HOQ09_10945 [Gemmatimonadaceae bacterium]|nr:hypothetical protein [Gemmatimonadaceae bacterium]